MAVEPPARPPPCPRDRIENHGHRRSNRRQSPQCLEEHRAPDHRGEGGVEPECSAAWIDRARRGGPGRGRAGFRAVAGGALDRAGAAGCPGGAPRGDGGAGGLADAACLAGGGEALQPRRAFGPSVLAASRAADRHPPRGLGQPGFSSRARAPGARPVGSGSRQAVAAAGRTARNNRLRERNPISGRPAGPEPLGVFAARVAARAGRRRKSAKTIKIRLRPAGIAANSARPARAAASSGTSDGRRRSEARPHARSRRSASARSRARAIAARRRASTAKARCR